MAGNFHYYMYIEIYKNCNANYNIILRYKLKGEEDSINIHLRYIVHLN